MIIVVGAGVAGLTAVRALADRAVPVTLVTAGRLGMDPVAGGNTALAQGGIAAALGPDDTPELHAGDTIAAGAGLVEPGVAQFVAAEGAQRVQELIADGFAVDRKADGGLQFGLEAAHGRARVVHAGEDSTGAALSKFLTAQVLALRDAGTVRVIDQAVAEHLTHHGQHITGLTVSTATGRQFLPASAVILATGGFAGLFPTTSSSPAVTGQGTLLAATAGAVLADMEFIQFHPTVLAATGQLISEAVRGAGAVLRDVHGNRFMCQAHPDAELAPRDVVSRTSLSVMHQTGTDHVWLDATGIEAADGSGTLAARFPVLTATLADREIDWTRQWVPVAPAAHYCMGGVATDIRGRTSVPGLFAAGEVAATGLHGANRLASNSLLEGLVFGARAASAAADYVTDATWPLDETFRHLIARSRDVAASAHNTPPAPKQTARLQRLVDRHLGMTRDARGLHALLAELDSVAHPMTDLVRVIATAAIARTESRGGHWRSDYPHSDASQTARAAWRLTPVPHIPDVLGTIQKEKLTHADA